MTFDDHPDQGGAWAPIIYGRTHRVDEWWRALPAGVARDGQAAGVIKAAIADGRVPAPRFVLARLTGGTLVGVVSSAGQFGTEMAADDIGRPLYCFVGWYSGDPRVAVPTASRAAASSVPSPPTTIVMRAGSAGTVTPARATVRPRVM